MHGINLRKGLIVMFFFLMERSFIAFIVDPKAAPDRQSDALARSVDQNGWVVKQSTA